MTSDLTFFSGDTKVLNIAILDATGAAVDVSTATSIKYGLFSQAGDPLVEKALTTGITVVTSTVTVTLAAADTANLAADNYIHELQITLAAGTVHTVMQGTVTIFKDYIVP